MNIQVNIISLLLTPSPRSHNANPLRTGGKKILTRVAGKDASKQFWKYHNDGILKKYKSKLQVGSLDTKKKETAAPPPAAEKKKEIAKPKAESGTGSVAPAQDSVPLQQGETLEPFGDLIPFGDPSWYQGVSHYRTSTIT